MERLKKLGINTVGILMEGRMSDRIRAEILAPPKLEQEAIAAALLDANELGLATVLIPHIYLADGSGAARSSRWTSPGAKLGGAHTRASSTWRVHRLGRRRLDALARGRAQSAVEGERHPRAHAGLAERVRRDYSGLLTYSANWDEADDVSFWDAVDVVGVNGYYPLAPDPLRGAEKVARELNRLALDAERPVLLLEVGFRSSPLSHLRPWEWPDHVDPVIDEASQANAWAAVLTHWLGAPGVRGLMVWVVPTDPDDPASEPRHGFNPLNKQAEEVIARVFTSN